MRTIKINTTEQKFFRQLLEVLKGVPPISKLNKREIDTMSELMTLNNKYASFDKDIRAEMILSKTSRLDIQKRLNMTAGGLNNNLSILRKHKLLTVGNNLAPFFDTIVFNDKFELNFKFTV